MNWFNAAFDLVVISCESFKTYALYEYHPPFLLSSILPTLALSEKHRLFLGDTSPLAGSGSP